MHRAAIRIQERTEPGRGNCTPTWQSTDRSQPEAIVACAQIDSAGFVARRPGDPDPACSHLGTKRPEIRARAARVDRTSTHRRKATLPDQRGRHASRRGTGTHGPANGSGRTTSDRDGLVATRRCARAHSSRVPQSSRPRPSYGRLRSVRCPPEPVLYETGVARRSVPLGLVQRRRPTDVLLASGDGPA